MPLPETVFRHLHQLDSRNAIISVKRALRGDHHLIWLEALATEEKGQMRRMAAIIRRQDLLTVDLQGHKRRGEDRTRSSTRRHGISKTASVRKRDGMLFLVPHLLLCTGRSCTCLMEHVERTLCLDADLELLAMLLSKDKKEK